MTHGFSAEINGAILDKQTPTREDMERWAYMAEELESELRLMRNLLREQIRKADGIQRHRIIEV